MSVKDQSGFSKTGHWYKGNLHSHTTNSDGKLSPRQAVESYKKQGYHFLCLSEHDLFTDYREEYNTPGFIVLPGVEASAVLLDGRASSNPLKVHHMHGILGTSEMQKTYKDTLFRHREYIEPDIFYHTWNGETVAQQLADKLRKRGCITTYNHPIWSRVQAEEFIGTEGLFGLEIFNYNTVNESGTGYDTVHWDTMLRKGISIHGFASDDNHNEGIFDDGFGGYVVVKAETLTHDNIISGLVAGNYYSTSGPEIYDWGIKNGSVYVTSSPVNRVNFICGNYVNAGGTVMGSDREEIIEYAEFKLRGNESYIRVECVDQYGMTAWTNAIFL